MKTKIIYISGNEVFEMAEIRAAFDEVRNALGLDKDTILFGVPVDADNALTETEPVIENQVPTPRAPVVEPIVEEIPETQPVAEIAEPIVVVDEDEEVELEPDVEQINSVTEIDVIDEAVEPAPQVEEKVIPILSILAAKQADEEPVESAPIIEDVIAEVVPPIEEEVETSAEIISDVDINTELVAVDGDVENAERISIGDMVDDEAPVAPMEKTLEQLLESMTPLREDTHNPVDEEPQLETTDFIDDGDADATLAQLASEFVEAEDKIVSKPKSETQGKIGKLKNILPFKKAKRDDVGLMGDLFGWAGIAANDDDFSMPGFFTTNAKKQGA